MIANVSVVIPTYNRTEKLGVALEHILACDPAPAEVITHVDGGDIKTAGFLRSRFPGVKVLESEARVGPGGGRNKLIAAASLPIVASFDDDSYPIDHDYFGRLQAIFDRHAGAAVLGGVVFEDGDEIRTNKADCRWVADFHGGACAYRRSAFLETSGYVPLPVAYGMEEVDLALRLHAAGWGILESSWLRVRHESDRRHQYSPAITAGMVANVALCAYLRYPVTLWWVGAVQTMKMIWLMIRLRRFNGVLAGLGRIPVLAMRYRSYRSTVSSPKLRSYLRLRRNPKDAEEAPPGSVGASARRFFQAGGVLR
jgi:GT2 family glycosyltransferase